MPGINGPESSDYDSFIVEMGNAGIGRPLGPVAAYTNESGNQGAGLKAATTYRQHPAEDPYAEALADGILADLDANPLKPGDQLNLVANSGGSVVAYNAIKIIAQKAPKVKISNFVTIGGWNPDKLVPSNVENIVKIVGTPGVKAWGDPIGWLGQLGRGKLETVSGWGHSDYLNSWANRATIIRILQRNGVR